MIYLLLFLEFFKVGLFTIGGGYAMIPIVRDLVLKYNWMSEDVFYNFIGVAESTPGPIAINMATYVGSTVGGFLGSVLATLGIILPSLIIITLIVALLNKLTENKYFKNAIEGIKPIVIGLILSTAVILFIKNIGCESITSFVLNIKSLILMIILVLLQIIFEVILKKKIKTIPFILISALLGIIMNLII